MKTVSYAFQSNLESVDVVLNKYAENRPSEETLSLKLNL